MDKETISYIINVLRRGTITWSGRNLALRLASRKIRIGTLKNGKPKMKTEWQCAHCLNWFKDLAEVQVDHIVEIGSFEGSFDPFIEKMYCLKTGPEKELQVLCILCHAKKTSKFNARTRYQRETIRRDNEMDYKPLEEDI